MKGFYSLALLILSNIFMTLAWYGHLKFGAMKSFHKLRLISYNLNHWGLSFFRYFSEIPANKIGFKEYGGPFTLIQLKVMQEVITLVVFVIFTTIAFKSESFKWNHILAFFLLIIAVYLVFKK